MPQPSNPAPKSKIDNLPAIKNWKPAPIFSALGVLAGLTAWSILASCIGDPLACAIQAIVVIVYALVFYRSYFTEKPRLTSSKGVSFLNYAIVFHPVISPGIVGLLCTASVIFGMFLNRNLKRSHDEKDPWMGISYIVVIVFFFALVGFAAWYESVPHLIANGDGTYTMTQPAADSAQSSSSSTTYNPNPKSKPQQLTIPGTNSQVIIPGDWECRISNRGSSSSRNLLALYPSSAKEYTVIMVVSYDMSQPVNEHTDQYGSAPNTRAIGKDIVLKQNSLNMDSVESETAELSEINGIEYWKVQTEGTSSDSNLPRKNVSYFCLVGANLYEYTLSATDESDETNEALAADLEQIVASASYQ